VDKIVEGCSKSACHRGAGPARRRLRSGRRHRRAGFSLWESYWVSRTARSSGKPKSCQIMLSALSTPASRKRPCHGPDKTACYAGGKAVRELLVRACIAELPALPESCPRCALPSPVAAVCGAALKPSPALRRDARTCGATNFLATGSCRRSSIAPGACACRILRAKPRVPADTRGHDRADPAPQAPRRADSTRPSRSPAASRAPGQTDRARGVLRVKDTPPQTELPSRGAVRRTCAGRSCASSISRSERRPC